MEPDYSELLRQAIEYLRAGKPDAARPLLTRFVLKNPNSERGWMLLSRAVSEPREQIDCLRRVLRLNPQNMDARVRLRQLNPGERPPGAAETTDTPMFPDELPPAASNKRPSPPATGGAEPPTAPAPETAQPPQAAEPAAPTQTASQPALAEKPTQVPKAANRVPPKVTQPFVFTPAAPAKKLAETSGDASLQPSPQATQPVTAAATAPAEKTAERPGEANREPPPQVTQPVTAAATAPAETLAERPSEVNRELPPQVTQLVAAAPDAAPAEAITLRISPTDPVQLETASSAPAAAVLPTVTRRSGSLAGCFGKVLGVIILAGIIGVATLAALGLIPPLVPPLAQPAVLPQPTPTENPNVTPSVTPTPVTFPTLPPAWTLTFTPSFTFSPTPPNTPTPVPPSATPTAAATPTAGAVIAAGNVGSLTQLTNWTASDAESIFTCFALSPDGQTVAAGTSGGTVRLWRASDGTSQGLFKGHTQAVTSVAFAPDGKTLVSASSDKTLQLWQVSDGTSLRTFAGHAAGVTSVAFAPDGQTIASGGADSTARLWRVNDGTLIYLLKEAAQTVAFSPDGQVLVVSGGGVLKLHRASDGARLFNLRETSVNQEQVAFSPDGKSLASGSADDVVRLWGVKDGVLVRTYKGAPPAVKPPLTFNNAAFSPDGQLMISGTSAGKIRVWQVNDATLVSAVDNKSDEIVELAFAPDGRTVYVLTHDGTLWWWGVK